MTATQEENLSLLHGYHDATDPAEKANFLSLLTEKNMGLVHTVVRRYVFDSRVYGQVDVEDLTSIGTMGMLKAIRSFDFSFETTFATYAVPLIIGEIRRHLRDDGLIRISRDTKKRGYAVLRAKTAFTEEHGREPTTLELAAASGEDPAELVFLLDASSPVHSISEPLSGGGDDGEEAFTLEHTLSDTDNAIDRLTESITLSEAIGKLPPFERQVLDLRYKRQLSQQQTASVLGVTQVKISRTEKKMFAFLRGELTK